MKTAREIAKSIIDLEFDKDIISGFRELFYEIARENGIKQGTKNECENGVTCDNFEWTMAKELFLDRIENAVAFDIMLNEPPEDIFY